MRMPWACWLALLPLAGAAVAADDVARELMGRALAPTPILADLQELTDDIGGRPTGSPALDEAIRWSEQKFREAGLTAVHAEPYTAPALWYQGGESGQIVAPQLRALRVAALPSPPLLAPMASARRSSTWEAVMRPPSRPRGASSKVTGRCSSVGPRARPPTLTPNSTS